MFGAISRCAGWKLAFAPTLQAAIGKRNELGKGSSSSLALSLFPNYFPSPLRGHSRNFVLFIPRESPSPPFPPVLSHEFGEQVAAQRYEVNALLQPPAKTSFVTDLRLLTASGRRGFGRGHREQHRGNVNYRVGANRVYLAQGSLS